MVNPKKGQGVKRTRVTWSPPPGFSRRDGRDPQEHWGWYVTHEYRAANSFGGKTVCKDRVVFDDEGENIVRVERVK